MHELEKHAEPNEKVLSHSCAIIDGMALFRNIGNAGLTYEEFALKLLNAVMSSGCSSSREDVVFDECYEISIKNAERAQRKSGNLEFKKTVSSQLKKTMELLPIIGLKDNRAYQIHCYWMEKECSSVFQQSDPCLLWSRVLLFFEDNCSATDHLFSMEVEADTRFLLHANDACLNWQDVVIHAILQYG